MRQLSVVVETGQDGRGQALKRMATQFDHLQLKGVLTVGSFSYFTSSLFGFCECRREEKYKP